jgi:hypothetical protein
MLPVRTLAPASTMSCDPPTASWAARTIASSVRTIFRTGPANLEGAKSRARIAQPIRQPGGSSIG